MVLGLIIDSLLRIKAKQKSWFWGLSLTAYLGLKRNKSHGFGAYHIYNSIKTMCLCFLFCINLYYCLLLITSCVSFDVSLFAAIRNILAVQNHNVQNQALHVAAFHGSVGLLPPYPDTTMPGGWVPENVSVTGLNARLLNFISTSRTCQLT